MNKDTIIISLGGSLIFPEEIDVDFLQQFKTIISDYVAKGHQVILVSGGGKICRKYNQSAKILNPQVTTEQLDWMGIKATKVNAELVKLMFGDQAYIKVLDTPDEKLAKGSFASIIVAGGWQPGSSSDNMAVNLAINWGSSKVINLTNTDYVYDKDPKKFSGAKPLENISWSDFRQLVGNVWDPGLNVPFDPIASQLAEKFQLEVVILNGKNLTNLNNYLNGRKFIGTVIR
jgi:uridylate kinase